MKPVARVALISVGIAVAGVGSYMLLRRSREGLQKDIVALIPANEVATLQPILEQMTRAELADTLRLIRATNKGVKITDTALKQRLEAISQKYNIFT
jgi:hypothetical protein